MGPASGLLAEDDSLHGIGIPSLCFLQIAGPEAPSDIHPSLWGAPGCISGAVQWESFDHRPEADLVLPNRPIAAQVHSSKLRLCR